MLTFHHFPLHARPEIYGMLADIAQDSINKAGSFALEGFKTPRGVQLGLRDIATYLEGIEP